MLRAPNDLDAADIARLFGQLGYPSTPADVLTRLAAMGRDAATAIWVAELEGRVVGLAAVKEFPGIHCSTPVAWLNALVVDERVRGRGMG